MILSGCLCLVLLNVWVTSAYDSAEKAAELNYYVVLDFVDKYETDFPALKKKFDDAELSCDSKINRTVDDCVACLEKNPGSSNSRPSPPKIRLDKVILGVIPNPVVKGFGNFGSGVKNVFAKKIPNFFTGTIPDRAGKIGKGVKKFVTGTIPKTFTKFGKDVDKFFTRKIPDAAKTVGRHVDKFFTKTIPNTGKKIIDGIGGLFSGRKRRAASAVCPVCNKIDKDTLSNDEIYRGVCSKEVIVIEQYQNAVTLFKWLQAENDVVTKVSFREDDTVSNPLKKVFTVKPFDVTYAIGAGATPMKHTESQTTLDLYDYTNTAFGKVLANAIWNEYVLGTKA